MNIKALNAEIIAKYKALDKLARLKPKDNVIVPYWQLNMGKWEISQSLGMIKCQRKIAKNNLANKPNHPGLFNAGELKRQNRRKFFIDAQIGKENVEINAKPFWMRKTKVLERINEALSEFLNNFNNNTVKKSQASDFVYTNEYVDYLLGKNPNFKRVTYNAKA